MATRGGQPGNNNGGKGKRWADALHKALTRFANGEIKAGQALDKIAENVVQLAVEGNKDAWNEIGNRLDGRPAQSVTVSGDPENPLEHRHIEVEFDGSSTESELPPEAPTSH